MVSFSEKVWVLIKQIPKGRVSTYSAIACALKKPKAARAVGNACNANQNAPIIPCHRVVCSDGKIGGYSIGVKKKIALLKKEGIILKNGKIFGFEKKLARFKNCFPIV
jgi:methylated-DNA-[protein]-cysteine S-methyltransferase